MKIPKRTHARLGRGEPAPAQARNRMGPAQDQAGVAGPAPRFRAWAWAGAKPAKRAAGEGRCRRYREAH
jgi:hypothetical protein